MGCYPSRTKNRGHCDTSNLQHERRPKSLSVPTHNDYRIGWICAVPVEMAAARAMLDTIHPRLPNQMGDTNSYILGSICGHNIVITGFPLGSYGSTSATVTALNMRQTYPSVEVCFLAGIGGGVPDPHDIRLGDVVVADPTADYRGVFPYDREPSDCRPCELPDIVVMTLDTLKAKHRRHGSDIPIYHKEVMKRHPHLYELVKHPGESNDQLFIAESEHVLEKPTCDSCDLSGSRERPRRPDNWPRVFYGLVASGGMLLKDPAERDEFSKQHGAICFEMEAAGAMDILPCLVIRGVCDYADSHKNELWQGNIPVTLTTAAHPPRAWLQPAVSSAQELLKDSCPREDNQSQGVIQSSFSRNLFDKSHVSSKHGFLWAVVHAYSHHLNLTIRPEDVWFSILTELNFYINANAEELRSFFVSHEGQKQLTTFDIGTINTVDFGAVALKFTKLIEKNVLDEELRDWIMPDFSTTTNSDSVVAAILMMGALQKYFSYRSVLRCGIPSVTLMGERADWARMVTKLDKLNQLGDEPARFAQLLRPVLNHLVLSFDKPEAPEVLSFWSKCAERQGGSGIDLLTGWVSAFCFWNKEKLVHREQIHPVSSPQFVARTTDLGLDDVLSRHVDTANIPPGSASVPISVDDNGNTFDAVMVAGLVGIQAESSGAILDQTEETGLDAIQPVSGWWMYRKTGAKEGD